jgi:hypothetical protein
MFFTQQWLGDEEYRQRCERRLQEELGIDPQDVEVILHMQAQIIRLHEQVRRLEQELESRRGSRAARFSHYHGMVIEATWYEAEAD